MWKCFPEKPGGWRGGGGGGRRKHRAKRGARRIPRAALRTQLATDERMQVLLRW